MVAMKEWEILSLSHKEGSTAVQWECDGSPEYKLTEGKKEDRGYRYYPAHCSRFWKSFGAIPYRIDELLKKLLQKFFTC